MINYDIKFITCDETLNVKNGDKRSDESVFDYGKRDYYVRRGGNWRAPHPRHLKQLESKLRDKTVVKSTWMTDTLISIVFSSGAIAYLTVKIETLDLHSVNLTCCSRTMIELQHLSALGRTALLFHAASLTGIQSIELGGGVRRTERHLSSCDTPNGARILVWSVAAAEPAPWSPTSAIEDLANLHLYQINGSNISLVAYHQLESETLCAELANRATKLSSRESATHVSVPAPARVARRAACDTRLLVACIDGSLHVVHRVAGIATDVQWVDELIVAAEESGRVQCYDRALSLLHHHTKCFDLTSYTR
ncbi:WD repeat-containing protein C2orf86 [Operophtera brumata]|uniref:WD repeat-containing protein C2orf86 n=1 Tax=Operophtera brumata TaxID=104452 RepID=A0A0L7KSB5_OPEBR|nr:WD repeat-containing protein C2orf86 [Operophtera brumata]